MDLLDFLEWISIKLQVLGYTIFQSDSTGSIGSGGPVRMVPTHLARHMSFRWPYQRGLESRNPSILSTQNRQEIFESLLNVDSMTPSIRGGVETMTPPPPIGGDVEPTTPPTFQ